MHIFIFFLPAINVNVRSVRQCGIFTIVNILKLHLISLLFRNYLYFLENRRINRTSLLSASIGILVFYLFCKLNWRPAITDSTFHDPHLSIFFNATDNFLSHSLSLYLRLLGRDCLSAKCSNFKHFLFVSLWFVLIWFDRGIEVFYWSICRRAIRVMIGWGEDEVIRTVELFFLLVGKGGYHLLGIV